MKTHKYQQIKNHFIEQIHARRLKGNDRIPSEKDLAAEWSVSPLTVGKALSQLEQEGYLVRKVGDGTYVRSEEELPRPTGERTEGESYIVMLVNNMAYGLVPHLIHLVEGRLSRLGHHIIIKNLNNSFEDTLQALKSVENTNASAFIFTPIFSDLYETENLDLLRAIEAQKRPVILVNGYLRRGECNCVVSDNMNGSLEAIRHLISRGHRRIALMWNERDSGTFDRMDGYKQALEEAHIELNEDYIVRCQYPRLMNKVRNPCEETLDRLMGLPAAPTAIFCLDEYLALYTEQFCRDRGLAVPGQLAIVGFDDLLPTRLTNVRQDIEQIASRTAELLIEALGGFAPQNTRIFVPTTLIIREST